MERAALSTTPPRKDAKRLLKRWSLKCAIFAGAALLILNPNLRRALEQPRHIFQPESLIETNFAGIEGIHSQIDRMLSASASISEPKMVEKFVYRNIRYATDYETWGNLEYWPAASRVWSLRQEDCDGRAILAASILRARGFASARLAVGLDHMWVQVDENEKDPELPSRIVALLGPSKDFSLAMAKKPKSEHFLALAKAFLQPAAFRDTTAHLIADIPSIRKALLIILLLALCLHPCSHRLGRLTVLLGGVLAAAMLAGVGHDNATGWRFMAAMGLLAVTALSAVCMDRLIGLIRRRRATATATVQPTRENLYFSAS